MAEQSSTTTTVIFLQWHEGGSANALGQGTIQSTEETAKDGACGPQSAPSSSPEKGPELCASWRVPRADGRLRPVDRLVLRYLRSQVNKPGDDTTQIVAVREISQACEVSRRTAQNALRRLSLQQLIIPLTHASGSTEGRRYHLSLVALEQHLTDAATPSQRTG